MCTPPKEAAYCEFVSTLGTLCVGVVDMLVEKRMLIND